MKKLFFILCSVSFILSSCNKNSVNDDCKGNAAELNGNWQMATVKDNATGTIQTKPAAIKAEVLITFSASGSSKGVLTGSTPTNTIYSSEYTTNCDQSFKLTCLTMTKVAENEWGILFVNHIRDASIYNFETDGKLSITTTNKTLSFVKL